MSTPKTKQKPEVAVRSTGLLCNPVSFKLPWTRFHNAARWMAMEVTATKFDDGGQRPIAWAVREGSCVLSKDGEWEMELSPSMREDDFISRTRWETPEAAAEAAREWAQHNEKGQR